jgi:predicted transposase/invertase (TIGR01784 family)
LSQESAYTKGELEAYDRYWDAVSVERTVIVDALAKGHQKGLVEGEQIGLERGEQAGLIKAARSMKIKGIPVSVIAECTGLLLEDIEKL